MTVIDPTTASEFLSQHRIAVVGASDTSSSFGGTIHKELRHRGYDSVAVNPNVAEIDGNPCYPDVLEVPGELDGAIVMVHRDKAADVVRSCITKGVPRVWLFQGLGGASAVSDQALELCRANDIDVVPGACPMMFLEPVGWFHRVHRGVRHLNGSLARSAQAA